MTIGTNDFYRFMCNHQGVVRRKQKTTRTNHVFLTTYNQAINFNIPRDTYFKVPTQIHKGASFF